MVLRFVVVLHLLLSVITRSTRADDGEYAERGQSDRRSPKMFATNAGEALRELANALPFERDVCMKSSNRPVVRLACAERDFLQRAIAWTDFQIKFRSKQLDDAVGGKTCLSFCASVSDKSIGFVVQGHKRFRKGYGNHAMGTLNALSYAILTNRSAVLGLDLETRELNMPHLQYDDSVIWTVEALRNRYLRCECHPLPNKRRHDLPLWHTQKQIAHLDGMAPIDRWPLAAEPGSPIGLGLKDALRKAEFFIVEENNETNQQVIAHRPLGMNPNKCQPIGDHFLHRGFSELNSMPNIYGILLYSFFRPSPRLAFFLSNFVQGFDIGIHVRVNLHVGTTTNGDGVLHAKEKQWRLHPLQEVWAHNLVSNQVPSLLRAGNRRTSSLPLSATVLLVSDQPLVAKVLADRLSSQSLADLSLRISGLDVNSSATEELTAITNSENDGHFMIRSADWGQSPRWASLAELFILSNARIAVACSGPYSPSTFCELAAALAAARRALYLTPNHGSVKHLLPTWRLHSNRMRPNQLSYPGSLFWCPSDGPKSDPRPPPCCETVVFAGGKRPPQRQQQQNTKGARKRRRGQQ